jgi:hypothetical protein
MSSSTEGTRKWAEQNRNIAFRNCIELLEKHGFNIEREGANLRSIPQKVWCDHSACDSYEAQCDWDAYRIYRSEFHAMSEYAENPPVADDGEIFYSRDELEKAGQGVLL